MQKLAMVALLSLSSAALAGDSTGCFTDDAAMIDIISSINETSHVNFAAIDGVCTSVYLAQSSATL